MADVVVNIRGSADQLRREMESVEQMPGRTNAAPMGTGRAVEDLSPSRLLEIVRATIVSQQAYTAKSAIDIVRAQQTLRVNDEITSKYDREREAAQARMRDAYSEIDRGLASGRGDRWADAETRRAGEAYDREIEDLAAREAQERKDSESELTAALRELTGVLGNPRTSATTTPDSYMGQLQAERRRLILERDLAPDREGALGAQGRLNDVEEKLRRVTGGNRDQGMAVWDPSQMIMGAGSQLMSGIQGGDVGSLVGGVGTAAVAAFSSTMKQAMRRMIYVEAARVAANTLADVGQTETQAAMGIGRYRSTVGGATGAAAAQNALGQMDGTLIGQMGYNYESYINRANQGILARGTGAGWNARTMRDIGLERALGLNEGAMTSAGQYDRYQTGGRGMDHYLVQMVDLLSQIKDSGVSADNFARVQEKWDITQGFLEGFKQFAAAPSAAAALRWTGAFSSMPGMAQDARQLEYAQTLMQNIQNPQSAAARSFIYSSVARHNPEQTQGGRADLVYRALHDQNQILDISAQVLRDLREATGGTNTSTGFFSAMGMTGITSPEILDSIMNTLGNPQSSILDKQKALQQLANGGMLSDAEVQKKTVEYQEQALEFYKNFGNFGNMVQQGFKDAVIAVTNGRGELMGRISRNIMLDRFLPGMGDWLQPLAPKEGTQP